jgi:hypothetical protein
VPPIKMIQAALCLELKLSESEAGNSPSCFNE